MPRKKILLRADDLGYSEGINMGIYDCVKQGVLKTIGCIVNTTYSQTGINLLKDEDVCLGLHVNITSGKRLSKEGNLSFISKNGHFVKLNKDVYDSCLKHDEVCLEVEEQYQKFKELANRKPDYMEGHALLHTVYLKAIEVVAKKHNVLFIPSLIHHDDALMIKEIPLYFWMESMSDNYHPMQCFQKICSNRREGCEVMILHPGYIDTYLCENSSLLKAREMEVEFIMHLDNIVSDKDNIEFVTYKDFVRGVKF